MNTETQFGFKPLDEFERDAGLISVDIGTRNTKVNVLIEGKINAVMFENDSYLLPTLFARQGDQYSVGNNALDMKSDAKVMDLKILLNSEKDKQSAINMLTKFILLIKERVEVCHGRMLKIIVSVSNIYKRHQAKISLACERAGFREIKFVEEDESILQYYLTSYPKRRSQRNVFIFHLGAGSMCASAYSVLPNQNTRMSTSTDPDISGCHIDENMLTYFKDKETVTNPVSLGIHECEKIKMTLSQKQSCTIEGANEQMDRNKFESINRQLFLKAENIVWQSLNRANMNPSEIEEVLLEGGCTRIPKVKQMLASVFTTSKLRQLGDPNCVAHGAALLGAPNKEGSCIVTMEDRNQKDQDTSHEISKIKSGKITCSQGWNFFSILFYLAVFPLVFRWFLSKRT